MAGNGDKKPDVAPNAAPASKPVGEAQELSLAALAQGILSREIRPRVADVRRLAEAVLAAGVRPGEDSKQAKGKKDKGGPGKKSGGKKRKLAKIPRPKSKK